jgi:hypothetical protein
MAADFLRDVRLENLRRKRGSSGVVIRRKIQKKTGSREEAGRVLDPAADRCSHAAFTEETENTEFM